MSLWATDQQFAFSPITISWTTMNISEDKRKPKLKTILCWIRILWPLLRDLKMVIQNTYPDCRYGIRITCTWFLLRGLKNYMYMDLQSLYLVTVLTAIISPSLWMPGTTSLELWSTLSWSVWAICSEIRKWLCCNCIAYDWSILSFCF